MVRRQSACSVVNIATAEISASDCGSSAAVGAAKAGRLDARAIDGVLTATGQRSGHTRRAAAIPLSEREVEVLRLVARQNTNKQIAQVLDIAPKTVERHVTNIYNKIGVTTRAGAALYATDAGLL
jgi:DNA-binding NarL/FixJ family response regulator